MAMKIDAHRLWCFNDRDYVRWYEEPCGRALVDRVNREWDYR